MGQKKNNNLDGQGFHTNPERINKDGRPPLLLSTINAELKQEGYEAVSSAQFIEAYTLLINLTEARIKAIIANIEYPMFLRIVGKAMLSAKGTDMIEKMLDRAYGKAPQKVQLSGEIGITLIEGQTDPKDDPIKD